MKSITVTKQQLLEIFEQNAANRIEEDVRLRITKKDVKDLAAGQDYQYWYELVPDFLPEHPKRYLISPEQFEQIHSAEREKLKKMR